MKIVSVVGARPQFIKASAVTRSLRTSEAKEVMVHTGQHYDPGLSDVFFEELEIPPPAFNLEVGSGPHGQQTGRMLEAIESVLIKERPDWVLVYGDTNSTIAGALGAAKLNVPVAHVEAGLRSFNRRMPEEVNRVLTDHASDLLFAPTRAAVDNLREEGIPEHRIEQVGDVMYDVVCFFADRVQNRSDVLLELDLEPGEFILATVHRAENTDDPDRLVAIFDALVTTSNEVQVVLPLHPRTRSALDEFGFLERMREQLFLTDPVGYLDMLMLESNACLIVTDSGGVQKEAFFQKTPCVTVRDETEWVELVELGWNRLAPPVSADHVESAIKASLVGTQGREDEEPYGTGNSASRIVDLLLRGEAAVEVGEASPE